VEYARIESRIGREQDLRATLSRERREVKRVDEPRDLRERLGRPEQRSTLADPDKRPAPQAPRDDRPRDDRPREREPERPARAADRPRDRDDRSARTERSIERGPSRVPDFNLPQNWDPDAARTLYIGKIDIHNPNLRADLTESFGKFGDVENVDIKSSQPPYAFVTFRRISQAMAAKLALHHTHVGRSIIAIGYGKVG
jgi:hypothetical protein